MYSTLVVSENKNAVSSIEDILKKSKKFKLEKFTDSLNVAKTALKKNKYNLLILELEGHLEDTLRWLKNNLTDGTELIIFHHNMVFPNQLLIFHISAFIDISELNNELASTLFLVEKKIERGIEKNKRLNNLLKIASQSHHVRISLSIKDGIALTDSNKIISITASKNSSEVNIVNQGILKINKPINEFEILLQDLNFFRIHRSHIINLAHVKQYIRKNGGSIEMNDASIFSISANKRASFNKQLQKTTLNLS